MRGRLIVDRANFIASGKQGRECPRIIELREAGVEIRVFKPRYQGYGFASLHAKTWILDDSLVLSGSVNLTECGMQGNKEHMYLITQPEVVTDALADFEGVWREAEPLSEELLERIAKEYAQRIEEKDQKEKDKAEHRSRSKSVQREAPARPQRAIGDTVDVAAPTSENTQE